MDPYVLVLATQICTSSVAPPLQILIDFTVVGADANGGTISFGVSYVYDNSIPAASNISNIKAAVVEQAAISNGVKLVTNNVNILMTVN